MIMKPLALFVLIAVGAIAGLAGVWVAVRRPQDTARPDPKWKPIFLCIMGFGMIGVGGFELQFFDHYAGFLKDIAGLVPGAEASLYQRWINDIASGKMPDQHRMVAQAYMLQNPVPQLDQMLNKAADQAQGEDRAFLKATVKEYQRKLDVAKIAAKALVTMTPQRTPTAESPKPTLSRLDKSSLQLLKHQPVKQIQAIKINPEMLKDAATATPSQKTP